MIRKFKTSDIDSLFALAKQFEKESDVFKGIGGIKETHFKNYLERYYSLGLLKIWVVEKDDEIVSSLGCIEIADMFSGELCLLESFWFCNPEHRGNLENIKLFKTMEKYGIEKGVKYIQMIHLVDSMPDKLEKFYIKNGYQLTQKCYNKEL